MSIYHKLSVFFSFNLHTARQLLKPQIHFHFNKVSAYLFCYLIQMETLESFTYNTHTQNYSLNNSRVKDGGIWKALCPLPFLPNINWVFLPSSSPPPQELEGSFRCLGHTQVPWPVSVFIFILNPAGHGGQLSQLSLSLCRTGNRASERGNSGKARMNPVLILKSDIQH